MLTGLDHSELLADNLPTGSICPAPDILQELVHLALTQDQLSFLTEELFELLRKRAGQPASIDCLGSIQSLASTGHPAGARLLAAFLNVATPGERLVPIIRPLDSSRRYHSQLLAADISLSAIQSDWQKRLARTYGDATKLAETRNLEFLALVGNNPRERAPWPMLRGLLGHLLERATDEDFAQDDEAQSLLSNLLRLEVDAWQERISQLAGNINPFRVESVARILPVLNRADSDIRDLRQMISWVVECDFESAFVSPQPRWRETLDDKDWGHLLRDLQSRDELAGLNRLAHGLGVRSILLPQLARGTNKVMALSTALVQEGVRDTPFDMFTSCLLAQSHYGNGQIVFAVEKELAESLAAILPDSPSAEHPLQGVSLMAGLLIIELNENLPDEEYGLPSLREMTTEEQTSLRGWREENQKLDLADLDALREQGLALSRDVDEEVEAEETEVEDMGASALKYLVMTNIQSVSVLLGFLRNPMITSIPGLVEEVVNRTRNPQIIATIASDRTLHTGFANKNVAMACLRSPVNVSVKTLRKFCHVKYVSKIELKRMANDRTGIRKEVAREIAKYLEALA